MLAVVRYLPPEGCVGICESRYICALLRGPVVSRDIRTYTTSRMTARPRLMRRIWSRSESVRNADENVWAPVSDATATAPRSIDAKKAVGSNIVRTLGKNIRKVNLEANVELPNCKKGMVQLRMVRMKVLLPDGGTANQKCRPWD